MCCCAVHGGEVGVAKEDDKSLEKSGRPLGAVGEVVAYRQRDLEIHAVEPADPVAHRQGALQSLQTRDNLVHGADRGHLADRT
jgi:hypothetical protein